MRKLNVRKKSYGCINWSEGLFENFDFISLHASAMVQSLHTGENKACSDEFYMPKSQKIGYFNTIDVAYTKQFKKKKKQNYPIFLEKAIANLRKFSFFTNLLWA